jgi:phosphonoacetate hydrolase
MDRRGFLLSAPALLLQKRKRSFVFLLDGLGDDYIAASAMPTLHRWGRHGIRKSVAGVMPSVTNADNASVCCGCFPEAHGITANFFLDEQTGKELYMEAAELVLRPTIFERMAASNIKGALLSAKKKTVSLLPRAAEIVLSAESPTPEWTQRLGPAPNIYSAEINSWLLKAAGWIAAHRPDIGLMYIHTTDYPMHMWPPEAPESKAHLAALDAGLAELEHAAPDAAMLVTADHGMHHKSLCWDLEKACAARGVALRTAISAEQDKYLKHHRGFGGSAWVYLKTAGDLSKAADVIAQLRGVEAVLTRDQAGKRFRTMPSRIGELVVLGDRETVFGGLDKESEELPANYRSHGGSAEATVPLIIFNSPDAPKPSYFQSNVDLARWL